MRHSLIQDKQAHTSVAGGTCACGAYCPARHHCHTHRERTQLVSVVSGMCMIVQVTEHDWTRWECRVAAGDRAGGWGDVERTERYAVSNTKTHHEHDKHVTDDGTSTTFVRAKTVPWTLHAGYVR